MTHRCCLAGSVRGMPGCPAQVPGCGVGMAGCCSGLCPRDVTPRPGTCQVDRPTRTVVSRTRLLEVMQHMRRAVGRPDGEKAVIVVLETAAATHRDEPGIADLGGIIRASPAQPYRDESGAISHSSVIRARSSSGVYSSVSIRLSLGSPRPPDGRSPDRASWRTNASPDERIIPLTGAVRRSIVEWMYE